MDTVGGLLGPAIGHGHWLRAGLTATLPRSPETETAEAYYARLQEVCADANRRHGEPETQRSRRAFRPFPSFKVSRVMPSSETKGRDQALCLQLWAAGYTFRRPTLAGFIRYQGSCLQLWVEGEPPRLGLI